MPRRPKPPPAPAPPKRRRRGTGSLTTLADGTIRARLPAPSRTAREFRPGQMAEATAWLDSALHPPAPTTTAPVTLGEWAGTWYETYVAPILAPNTARHYLYLLQQLAPLYGRPLADLRPSLFQSIVSAFTGRVGAATVQQAVSVWRRCLEAAVDDDLLERNPVRRLTLPKPKPRQARRHVSPQEAAILAQAIVGHRFEAAYALLLGCGLRIGEVLGLAWSDVDLQRRRTWIQRQWTGSGWRELPKGRNPHHVRLPPLVVAALIRHRDRQPEGATLVMQSPYPRKRTHETQPWSAMVVTGELHTLVATLDGIARLTPHSARHGLASALLDAGTSPAEIAERLGHSDPSVTLKSYVHGSPEGRERADALIDAYLSGEAPGDDSGTEPDRYG